MRDIDHHSEIVRAGDHFAAKTGETAMLAALFIRGIAESLLRQGAVGKIVMAVMDKTEIARTKIIIEVKKAGLGRQRIAILYADQRDELTFLVQTANISRGQRKTYLILILNIRHAADGGELPQRLGGSFRVAGRVPRGLAHIDDEEGRIHAAFAHTRKIHLNGPFSPERGVVRRGTEEARNVDMGVDHDGGAMDALDDLPGRRFGRGGHEGGAERPERGKKEERTRHDDAPSQPVHPHAASLWSAFSLPRIVAAKEAAAKHRRIAPRMDRQRAPSYCPRVRTGSRASGDQTCGI